METKQLTFSELIKGDKPVLVDFSAEWCAPCRMMKPILKELKEMVGDEASIIQVDVDRSPMAASVYQVQSVPTLAVFKNGNIVWRRSGVTAAAELKSILSQFK
ncbi:MAG TPA: thioredoxin [Chitinophagales bacterium]|nr:thioredoxin [Chitinophagales bacterium]